MGTQAHKRLRKAVPPTEDPPVLAGCLVWLAMYLFLCASLFAFTKSLIIAAFALPALVVMGAMAVPLNWSERSSWRSTLDVRVFKRFCGQERNFNPAVVVFRGLDEPQVFRFFYAFQELKAGRPEYVQHLESELWKALELD